MTHRKKDRPALAAARAGFSTATAYLEADPGRVGEEEAEGAEAPGSAGGDLRGGDRAPAGGEPGLRAVALYEEMMRRHPDLHHGVRRTLERRVRGWKAKHGPEREIIFRQKHEPGRRGLSDFTDAGARASPGRLAAVPLPAGVLGVLPCGGGAGRGELRGAGRWASGRAVGAGRRAEGAPDGQPAGGVSEPEAGGDLAARRCWRTTT